MCITSSPTSSTKNDKSSVFNKKGHWWISILMLITSIITPETERYGRSRNRRLSSTPKFRSLGRIPQWIIPPPTVNFTTRIQYISSRTSKGRHEIRVESIVKRRIEIRIKHLITYFVSICKKAFIKIWKLFFYCESSFSTTFYYSNKIKNTQAMGAFYTLNMLKEKTIR